MEEFSWEGLKMIDLRSDTVTLPTEAMLEAMKSAPLGDDVYEEDPTVRKLEEIAAEKLGKEKALFVPSGTMSNLIALICHTTRGQEVITDPNAHVYFYEVGGLSAVAGLAPRFVDAPRGVMNPEDINAAIREANIHYAKPGLICIENSHNRAGGTVASPTQIYAIREVADKHGLPLHLDGARIFNAAIALRVDVKLLTEDVDSVMFCLSKGLSAPAGSILAGPAAFIKKARRIRKMLGGGMRQVGVLAAAGIVALETMIERLVEDNSRARKLAVELNDIPGVSVNLDTVQTNILVPDATELGLTANQFATELERLGVKISYWPPHQARMVTHRHITDEDVKKTLEVARLVAKNRLE